MKRILIPLFLIAAFSAKAQIDTTVLQFAKLPDSTGFGTPDGKLISKEMGVSGGNIASDDGRVELIFPAGALLTNTAISIQPITNPLFSGTGKAYQFEPSGIQFKKPVQIVFHYTKEESETCPADLMNIAMQDHTGKWSFSNYEKWDSTERTLKGFIHHFSSMANSNGSMIKPEKEITVVGGTVPINFYDRYGTVQSGPFIGNRDRIAVGDRYWAVNDVKGGDEQVGYAAPPRLSTSLGAYTAPNIIPKRRNPVVISFYFEYYSDIVKQNLWGVVTCKITVFDKYKVEVTHLKTGRASMNSELTDKGSFVLTIWPREKFDIDDIKNYPPTVIKEGRNGPFKEKVITEGADGSIHLTASIKNKSLSEDYPPKVHLEFTPQHSLMCKLQYRGRGTGNSEPTMIFTTIPEEIKFIANGQAQEYIIDIGHLDDEDKTYKLVITPHRVENPK